MYHCDFLTVETDVVTWMQLFIKLLGSKMTTEKMNLDLCGPWTIRNRQDNLQMCFFCLKQCDCSHDINRHVSYEL